MCAALAKGVGGDPAFQGGPGLLLEITREYDTRCIAPSTCIVVVDVGGIHRTAISRRRRRRTGGRRENIYVVHTCTHTDMPHAL